jgi:ABC-type transport system involved in multi-copper enzyme maturation permease subunit
VNSPLRRLFVVELRRQWSVLIPFVPLSLGAIVYIIVSPWNSPQPTYEIARRTALANFQFLIPILTSLFSTGMVAADVKDGWLRTLLIRPITRQEYLVIRMLATLAMTWVALLIAGILPIEIAAHVSGKPIERDWIRLCELYATIVGQTLLLNGILAFLSCWLPSISNVVILFLWYMTSALLGLYLQTKFWNNKWLTIARDYLFPHGFTNAGMAIAEGSPFPWMDALWGMTAVTAFLALAFWSINQIDVDKTSD